MNTVNDLFNMLGFGKHSAKKATELYDLYLLKRAETEVGMISSRLSLDAFKRRLRTLSSLARHQGTRIIGDENGYYIAVNNDEWNEYKRTRFAALKEELESFASCERLSVRDLIKEVYCVNVENPNFELQL